MQGLRGGETVIDSMQMLTIDGSAGFTLQIAITGVNDAASITGTDTGDVHEDGGLVASGTLDAGDVDHGENELVPRNEVGGNGYGNFLVNADGSWTYTLNNAHPDVQLLDTGMTLTDTITVFSEDGTDSEDIVVTIHGADEPNAPPVIANLDGDSFTQTEGIPGNLFIDVGRNSLVTDPDSADFAGGTLTVAFTTPYNGTNSLGIFGDATTSYDAANNVFVNGTIIGTVTGGSTDTPLTGTMTVTFNGNATPALVELLMRAVFAGDQRIEPAAGTRTLSVALTDGDGGSSSYNTSFTVVSVNDEPAGADKTIGLSEDGHYVMAVADFGFDPNASGSSSEGQILLSVRITTLPTDGTLYLDTDGAGTGSLGAAVTAGQDIAAADIAAGRLVFVPQANENGVPYASFTFQVQDDGGTDNGGIDRDQSPNTITFDVAAVNDAPAAVSLAGDAASYTGGQPQAALLDTGSDAVITDLDSVNFDGGTLTVAITGGLVVAEDRLVIRLTGTVSFNASGVFVNGTQIATHTGHNSSGPLVFTFDPDATPAAVSELVRAIAFSNSAGTGPTAGVRTIGWTFVDGDGGAGTLGVTTSVNVISPNTPPVVDYSDNVTFVEDNPGTPGLSPIRLDLDQNGSVADNDSANFDGGTLTLSISSGGIPGEDVLFVETFGAVSVAGSDILVGGTIIGTWAGGTYGNPFVVTFNADATPANVTVLMRALVYDNVSQEPTQSARFYSLVITDGDGGTSNTGTGRIDVSATNDAPTGMDKAIGFNEDTPYTFTAADFGFGDVDGDALLSVLITTLPGAGTLTLNGGAVTLGQEIAAGDIPLLVFTPAPNANGAGYASFTFQVRDNGGTNNASGAPFSGEDTDQSANTITLNVLSVNDRPVLSGLAVSATFLENDGPVVIDGDVVLSDVEGIWGGGFVIVAGMLPEDLVGVRNQGTGAGQIGVSGSDITYEGVIIATFTGGAFGSSLFVTLNAAATTVAVDALVQNLTYDNVSDTPTASRNLTIHIVDGAGAHVAGSPTFTPVSGVGTPLNGLDAGTYATPEFFDIDGDGDLDLVVGSNDATIKTFRNDGGGTFVQVTGSANPFTGLNTGPPSGVNQMGNMAFVDLDGDGDLDMVTGNGSGSLLSFRNNGVGNAFTALTGTDNPFDGLSTGIFSHPSFFDFDGDGDLDALVGQQPGAGGIRAFQNNGPGNAFTALTGPANPFDGINVGYRSNLTYMDLDGDGDLDVIAANFYSPLQAFRNNGPGNAFTAMTGAANPLAGIDVGSITSPDVADVDGDGDLDIVVGRADGTFLVLTNDGFTPPTITVNVTAQNDRPVIANGGNEITTYVENGAPVVVAPAFTIADPDSPSLTWLSVVIGGTSTDDDRLTFTNDNAALYGNISGTYDIGTRQLLLTSAGNTATIAQFEAAARAILFSNVSDNPIVGTRNISFLARDSGGLNALAAVQRMLDITPVNDAPTGTDATLTLNEDGTRTLAIADFGYSDPENNSFTGVVITTLPTNGALLLNGATFAAGTIVTAAQISGNQLVFVPDANENGLPYASFTFQVQDNGGTDNGGLNTDQSANTITVDVNPVNDAPVIGLLANNTAQYFEGGVPVRLDLGSNATVTDVDSPDFGGGSLTVSITTGLVAGEDVLGLDGSGTVALSNGTNVGSELSIGGIAFGTITASSNSAITISFNSDATPARVQELLRIFNYTSTNDLNPSTATRTINWTLVDGDGIANGGADTRSINSFVVITPVNDAPSGAGATIVIVEDTQRTLNVSDFGFSDGDGNSLIAVLVSPSTAGTLLLNGNPVTLADTFVTLAQINAGQSRLRARAQRQWRRLCQLRLPGAGQRQHRQWRREHRPVGEYADLQRLRGERRAIGHGCRPHDQRGRDLQLHGRGFRPHRSGRWSRPLLGDFDDAAGQRHADPVGQPRPGRRGDRRRGHSEPALHAGAQRLWRRLRDLHLSGPRQWRDARYGHRFDGEPFHLRRHRGQRPGHHQCAGDPGARRGRDRHRGHRAVDQRCRRRARARRHL